MQPSYPPPGYDPYQQQKKGPIGWLIGGGVLLAALIGFGLGTGFFGLMGGSKPALNQQANAQPILPQTQEPAPVFMQEAQPAPITPQEAKRMPQDILDWLKHLEETERRFARATSSRNSAMTKEIFERLTRGGLSKEAFKELAGGDLDSTELSNPTDSVRDNTSGSSNDLSVILSFFKSYPPPSECVPIYQSYLYSMNEISAMIKETEIVLPEIDKYVESMGEDDKGLSPVIEKLSQLSANSDKRADDSRRETDALVAGICAKYDTRKWFTIPGDIGGGLPGIGGGLGPMLDLLKNLSGK